jgi:hypothetical protein
MFDRIHQKLGTAGFVISIVALVAALGGGAYAASGGLDGKQKKEVRQIAKRYATAGVAGAVGPAGPAGKNGARGAEGLAGENGVGVTTAPATSGECPSGGIRVISANGQAKVCDGAAGSSEGGGGGFSETLPSGKTETGVFSSGIHSDAETEAETPYGFAAPVIFSIPLAAPIAEGHALYVTAEEQEVGAGPADCPGSAESPSAQPGTLCIYQGSTRSGFAEPTEGVEVLGSFTFQSVVSPVEPPRAGESHAATAGAIAYFIHEGPSNQTWLQGSWAVTAP